MTAGARKFAKNCALIRNKAKETVEERRAALKDSVSIANVLFCVRKKKKKRFIFFSKIKPSESNGHTTQLLGIASILRMRTTYSYIPGLITELCSVTIAFRWYNISIQLYLNRSNSQNVTKFTAFIIISETCGCS